MTASEHERPCPMTASRITRLSLTHFRSYRAAAMTTEAERVVLVGANGAGKTNCLEAISFMSPGRGLRRATLDDVAENEGDGSWALNQLFPDQAHHYHSTFSEK